MQKDFPEEKTALQDRIQSQGNLIERTIKSVQRICTDLRPQILDVFGICEAIAWQAGEYASRTGIKFDLNCLQENIKLDRDLITAIFRIFQEITTNIVRHAQASKVIVRLNQEKDLLVLEVKDNGLGIQEHQITDSKSLGILGMRERVLFWDGEINIHGNPGKGTTVTIKIPYKKP
ncbi:MAG: sensor histidine kinase, partial [Nitrospinales bacterium]